MEIYIILMIYARGTAQKFHEQKSRQICTDIIVQIKIALLFLQWLKTKTA